MRKVLKLTLVALFGAILLTGCDTNYDKNVGVIKTTRYVNVTENYSVNTYNGWVLKEYTEEVNENGEIVLTFKFGESIL